MNSVERIARVFDRLLDLMVFLAGVFLVFVTVAVCAEVGTRYFFNYPMGWVTEISSYILLFITFLVAAWVLREEGHVSMDFIIGSLSTRAQMFVNAFTSVVSSAVCIVLTVFAIRVTWDLYKTGYFTPTMLELPKFPLVAIIAIGMLLLSVQFVRRSLKYVSAWKAARRGERSQIAP